MNHRTFKTIIVIFIIFFILTQTSLSFADGSVVRNIEETNEKLTEFKELVDHYANIFLAFGLATSVLIFIIHFIKLANAYDHPLLRQEAIRDIWITGLCTALMGAIGLITKLIMSSFL